jgi:chromosome segregation ATPase
MDILHILEKIAPTALSGAAGVFVSVWKFARALDSRVFKVEGAIKACNDEIAELFTKISDVKESKATEVADIKKRIQRLSATVASLSQDVDACKSSLQEYNQEMSSFIREQQEQWQTMSRTMGQIEGFLRATMKKPSGTFPGMGGQ